MLVQPLVIVKHVRFLLFVISVELGTASIMANVYLTPVLSKTAYTVIIQVLALGANPTIL